MVNIHPTYYFEAVERSCIFREDNNVISYNHLYLFLLLQLFVLLQILVQRRISFFN